MYHIVFASFFLGRLWVGQLTAPGMPADPAHIGALGIAAYERTDYADALYLLRAAVEAGAAKSGSVDGIDAWSGVYLSRMYLLGQGTSVDPTLACALFRAALAANEVQTRDANAASKFLRLVGQNPCAETAESFHTEVRTLLSGCFLRGINKSYFQTENGSIVVDRLGVHMDFAGTLVHQALPVPLNCATETVSIGLFPVFQHSESRRRPRYFLSVFSQASPVTKGASGRRLQWRLFEVDSTGVKLITLESLSTVTLDFCSTVDCATWLGRTVSFGLERDNQIYWRLDAFNRSGLVK